MANLLLDPTKWTDDQPIPASPPPSWNAAKGNYEFMPTGAHVGLIAQTTAGVSTVTAGDIVAFTFDVTVADPHPPASYSFLVNGAVVWTIDLTVIGSKTFTSAALAAGDRITTSYTDAANGAGSLYGVEFTITPTPNPPAPVPDCTELGRVTRANVSAYQRARVQHSRLVRGEKRCLIANFNGAFDPARTIVSATWRCEQPYYVGIANARIPNAGQFPGREAAVDITAQLQGFAWLKCEAMLDNGELYTQVFTVAIMNTPYFYGESFPTLGPYVLTATYTPL